VNRLEKKQYSFSELASGKNLQETTVVCGVSSENLGLKSVNVCMAKNIEKSRITMSV
jgi:hypothetical protein